MRKKDVGGRKTEYGTLSFRLGGCRGSVIRLKVKDQETELENSELLT